jgi:hypothetical protein
MASCACPGRALIVFEIAESDHKVEVSISSRSPQFRQDRFDIIVGPGDEEGLPVFPP